MAKTRRTGAPIPQPRYPRSLVHNTAPTLGNPSNGLTALDHAYMITGAVIWADGAQHDLQTVHFRGQTGTLTGTLTVSARDPSLSAGPPARDDGTADQSGTLTNPAATTNHSVTFGANRTLAHGAEFTLRFQITAFTSGSFNLGCIPTQSSSGYQHRPAFTHHDGGAPGTYTPQGAIVCITLEASDGTFGIFVGSLPRISALNAHAFNSGSGADELAIEFTVGAPRSVGELGFIIATAAGADFDLVLYDGTTALVTRSFDQNTMQASAEGRDCAAIFADQDLVTGHTYRAAVKPTTAFNVTVYSIDVTAAGHLAALMGTLKYTDRVDGNAWAAATATRGLLGWIGFTAEDDGTGGGSSGSSHLVGGALAA